VKADQPIPLLTAAQRALVDDAPHVVARARSAVRRDHGELLRNISNAQLDTEGTIAVGLAARSFDPERGTFDQWAFYKACFAMLDLARDDGRFAKLKATARAAFFRHLCDARPSGEVHEESREAAQAGISATAAGQATAIFASLGLKPAVGEADVIERETIARVSRSLQRVVSELKPEQQRLLELCFAEDHSVKDAARVLGVGYRSVLTGYHELMDLMGARLRSLGVHEPPPRVEETILQPSGR
jgi:DNA-directed RNA polymerase specialized sigma24 family protein